MIILSGGGLPWDQMPRLAKSVTIWCQVGGRSAGDDGGALPRQTRRQAQADSKLSWGSALDRLVDNTTWLPQVLVGCGGYNMTLENYRMLTYVENDLKGLSHEILQVTHTSIGFPLDVRAG
jgi:hypothetical protein